MTKTFPTLFLFQAFSFPLKLKIIIFYFQDFLINTCLDNTLSNFLWKLKLNQLPLVQCDQVARLSFSFWPITTNHQLHGS